MKRKLFKSLFAVAAIAAVGLGSYKAYGSYVTANMSEDDLLWAENVEAITQSIESSANTYRKLVFVEACYGPEDVFFECPGYSEEHMDTYSRRFVRQGDHYACKIYTHIPSPWTTKPADECESDKNCVNGTMSYANVPDEYKGGRAHEIGKWHQ